MRPTFLVIGGQRCGTTWLHRCLSEHPQIAVAPMKEVHFFDCNWANGIEWYESLFAKCGGAKAVGEATPGYIFYPEVPGHIASIVPDAKFIAILRNPIDRAYSAYWFKRGLFRGKSFEEVLDSPEDRVNDLLARGRYAEQLERYYRHFPKEQMLVMIFEQMQADPAAYLRRVFGWLGVAPEFQAPSTASSINAVFFRQRHLFQRPALAWIIRLLKKTPLVGWLRRRHHKSGRAWYPPMQEATRQRLREYYAPECRRLTELIGLAPEWV